MARRRTSESERTRRLVAQEAARIVVGHGIRDYRLAKQKAADRLGVGNFGSLPGNEEIEAAVAEHLAIFRGDEHEDHLRLMRVAALSAMELLAAFSPRLVGPVLTGTADENSAINLHVFADAPEMVAMALIDLGVSYKPYERRLKTRRDQVVGYAGFEFHQNGRPVQATVFPIDGIRQAPISPIDGRPMKRVGIEGVQRLLEHI